MLSCKEQKAVGRMQKAENSPVLVGVRRYQQVFLCLLLFAFCLLSAGCRGDMQDQPNAIAYRENSFFKDGTGSRPLVEGTVPRGYLREDRSFFFGKKLSAADLNKEQQYQVGRALPNNPANPYPDDVDTI